MTQTTIRTAGTLLIASVDARTLTYRLLPYGEQGRTNVGRVTASKGSVTLPEDPSRLLLNLEHDRKRPVGKGVSIEDTDGGLVATFAIARTRAGDDLLEEAHEGLRAAVSVEIDSPVIRGGKLLAGLLTGAGAVVDPAFPSAQLVAADAGELPKTLPTRWHRPSTRPQLPLQPKSWTRQDQTPPRWPTWSTHSRPPSK
ncbi:hypothetical protein [Georgenia yuyongxinii]